MRNVETALTVRGNEVTALGIMVDLEVVRTPDPAQKRTRLTSGTSCPYFDLEASIKVAEVVHKQGGGVGTSDQLAAWLGYSTVRSGTFLTRIAAARQFGLIESTSKDQFSTTDRARLILMPVMPSDALDAKVQAFLSVGLFAQITERFKGQQLPHEAGMANLLLNTYKIVPDRVASALRIFYQSADQAGFFKTTGDRTKLIRPSTGAAAAPAIPEVKPDDPTPETKADEPRNSLAQERHRHGSGGDGGPPGIHTAIIGLLRELPPAGTPWPSRAKERFLTAFKGTIDFIYPEDDP